MGKPTDYNDDVVIAASMAILAERQKAAERAKNKAILDNLPEWMKVDPLKSPTDHKKTLDEDFFRSFRDEAEGMDLRHFNEAYPTTFDAGFDYCTHIISSNKIMTPNERLKKLFKEDKITADKYSELFGVATDADLESLDPIKFAPPIDRSLFKKRTVIDMIEERICALHYSILSPKDFVIVLGWNKKVELERILRNDMGPRYYDAMSSVTGPTYKGYDIVAPTAQDDGNTVLVMLRSDYHRRNGSFQWGNKADMDQYLMDTNPVHAAKHPLPK